MNSNNKPGEDCNCNCCINRRQIEEDKNNNYVKMYRPWGWYQTTMDGDGFKIKTIFIEHNYYIGCIQCTKKFFF